MAYRPTAVGALLSSPDPVSQQTAKAILQRALKEGRGNLAEAARLLNVPWKTAHRWMAKAGIRREMHEIVELSKTDIIRAGRKTGSVGAAAESLGVSRNTLAKRAKAAGITLPDGRRGATR